MSGIESPGGVAPLGGHQVARVGYGAMQLAGRDDEAAIAVLREAVELGVDHIDTAEFYGGGSVNRVIRRALAPYGDDLALVTKVGADEDAAAGLVAAQRPEQLRRSLEQNLRSLGVERVAVVNLRRADAQPGIIAEGDQIVDLDAQLAELIALRDEGKIGGIGLSNVSAAQLERALPAGIVCVQNAYNVLYRADEPVLDLCRGHGIAWVPYFPLGSAFDGWAGVAGDTVVAATAASLGVTAGQVGLAWLLAHYDRTLLIPGTSSPAHLRENVAAGSVRLGTEIMDALDRLAV